jgi:hypothetical protein
MTHVIACRELAFEGFEASEPPPSGDPAFAVLIRFLSTVRRL